MDLTRFEEKLSRQRLLPLFTPTNFNDSRRIVDLFVENGFPLVELTLRDSRAVGLLPRLVKACPEAVLGAGTVLNTEQLTSVMEAGAEFAVSPGLPARLERERTTGGFALLPGVATPSEVVTCLDHGYHVLKLFPGTLLGGADYLRALAGPFPGVGFCVSGGVTPATLPQLLRESNVIACSGSWLIRHESEAMQEMKSRLDETVDILSRCSND